MADKIVVMHDGIVEQMGTRSNSTTPANQFVAGFIGSPAMNFLKGKVKSNAAPASKVERGQTAAANQRPPIPKASGRAMACGPSTFTIAVDGAEAEIIVVEPTGSETQSSPSRRRAGRRRVPRTTSIQSGRQGPAQSRIRRSCICSTRRLASD